MISIGNYDLFWLLSALSIVGVVLNIHKKKACFWIWSFTNAAWCVIDWQAGLYAQSALFAAYFMLAVWGLVKWNKDRRN